MACSTIAQPGIDPPLLFATAGVGGAAADEWGVAGVELRVSRAFVAEQVLLVGIVAVPLGRAPEVSMLLAGGVALAMSAIFIAHVCLHELGHVLATRAGDVRVLAVELTALGGATRYDRPATTALEEFRLAAAGPMVSGALLVASATVAHSAFGWRLDEMTVGVFSPSSFVHRAAGVRVARRRRADPRRQPAAGISARWR